MSLTFSRYTRNYLKLARPDVSQKFPRHVFVRDPNRISATQWKSDLYTLTSRHEKMTDATMIHLTESIDNSELFLIGTMNSSNFLANRTKHIINEIKPNVVMIQANEKWGKAASLLQHVKSQEEMDLVKKELAFTHKYNFPENSHYYMFQARWYLFVMMYKLVFGLPLDWNPLVPGLEMKYALEEANKLGIETVYLGDEFDSNTWNRLHAENRYTLLKALNGFRKMNSNYQTEKLELKTQIAKYGIKNFVESSLDQYTINWFIQTLDQIFPSVKRIMIEQKEEDLFQKIIANKGKKTVVVVNQMHMEGIEHHWCHAYGQVPRNMPHQNIDPIGDMDLRSTLFENMYHVLMREIKSARTKNPPASYSNMITPYFRESNFQFEHRNM